MTPAIEVIPQAMAVLRAMQRNDWSITAREAMLDLDMTSATLSRRICDLEEAGVEVVRERKVNPVSMKRYTRYWLIPEQLQELGSTADMFAAA
jgi:DNA-binding MarR family transcriptional regulator